MDDLIETRLDFFRDLAELGPLLAKLRRMMRRRQLVGGRPLNVVDDVTAVLNA